MPKQYPATKRSYKFGPSEVLAAVESLYADKVQPIGRILLKRLGERAAPASQELDPGSVPRIDPRYLRSVCDRCDRLVVETMDSGEYSVLIAGRTATFVDASSENDPYPAKLWEELAAFFEGLEGEAIFWPSGRFACAQALVARGPSCLAYRSLGELVHIVQLSVGQKKILGYRSGHLVPYGRSELKEKEECATCQQPVASAKSGAASSLPLASWEEVCSGLAWLLSSCELGAIQLPNVKRLFRSDLGLELSETTLGYARIFELLHDPRMSSICDLRLEGKNWMVVRKQVEPLGFEGTVYPLGAGARQPEIFGGPGQPAGFTLAAPSTVDPEFARFNFQCLSTSPLSTVAPSMTLPMQFAPASPPQFDASKLNFETTSFASTWDPMEGDLDSPRSTSGSSGAAAGAPGGGLEPEPVEMDFSFTVKNTFIDMVPSPNSKRRSSSVPRCMRLARRRSGGEMMSEAMPAFAFGEFPPALAEASR